MARAWILIGPVLIGMAVLIWLAGSVTETTQREPMPIVSDSPAEDRAEVGAVGTATQEDHMAGCEVYALMNALQKFGIELSFEEAYGLFDKSQDDFVTSWWGDPDIEGAAYPPAMVTAAERALDGTAIQVRDMTGETLEGVHDAIEGGGVAIVWVTTDDSLPVWTGWVVDGYEMYANEHCVVVHGIDGEGVRIMDSLKGDRVMDTGVFNEIWQACGAMGVAIG